MRPLRTAALGFFGGLGLAGWAGGGVAGFEAQADAPQPVQVPAGFSPSQSLAPLVDVVQPAVVNVYVSSKQAIRPELQWYFGLPSERTVEGQGSGFVISADGYILTNNHVVKGGTDVKVKFADGQEYPARVVGADRDSDVALLKISADRAVPHLRLAAGGGPRVGDWVVAVGNPLGLGHTVTAGIVSGIGRNIPDLPLEEFIQTDASINPGNSGGPLVALDGTVVGMNTAILSGANSVGFAIPAAHIRDVLPQLKEHGRVTRGYLGVQMATLPEVARQAIGGGVLIAEVIPGGPADKAGIQVGDVVIQIGGRPVQDHTSMLRTIAASPPGADVAVKLLRQGKDRTIVVKLAPKPAPVQTTDEEDR